jgi:hypothetical protein
MRISKPIAQATLNASNCISIPIVRLLTSPTLRVEERDDLLDLPGVSLKEGRAKALRTSRQAVVTSGGRGMCLPFARPRAPA